MAVGQHSRRDGAVPAVGPETARRASLEVTRRTLLGAVCAAPLVRHPGLDPGSKNIVEVQPDAVSMDSGFRRNDEWDRALARFETAEAAIAAAAGAPDHVYDLIGARHHAAMLRLLRTPAPDLAALARKLDLALDERTGEYFGDAAAMKAMKRDAHRLAASAA